MSLDMKRVYFTGFINTACICKFLVNKAFVVQAPKMNSGRGSDSSEWAQRQFKEIA